MRIRAAIAKNQEFIREIVDPEEVLPHWYDEKVDIQTYNRIFHAPWRPNAERQSRVRSTLRQCIRDWSTEGEAERASCYGRIEAELDRLFPLKDGHVKRNATRVLCPGSGLARLVWNLAYMGFDAQGNEFSYYMLLCSFTVLNRCPGIKHWTIYPYVYETKNLWSASDQLKAISIPDVDPNTVRKNKGSFSMAAGDFLQIYLKKPGFWDVVATCFFIDTANNILQYMRVISRILRDGGYWINFGPLLYHYADMPGELSIELTYEEVRRALPYFGFRLEKEVRHLPSSYTSGTQGSSSMWRQSYDCVLFVCVKDESILESPWCLPSRLKPKEKKTPDQASKADAPSTGALSAAETSRGCDSTESSDSNLIEGEDDVSIPIVLPEASIEVSNIAYDRFGTRSEYQGTHWPKQDTRSLRHSGHYSHNSSRDRMKRHSLGHHDLTPQSSQSSIDKGLGERHQSSSSSTKPYVRKDAGRRAKGKKK